MGGSRLRRGWRAGAWLCGGLIRPGAVRRANGVRVREGASARAGLRARGRAGARDGLRVFGRGWRGGRVRGVVCGGGELAGLPEPDEVFEAGEDAREAGHDEGVNPPRPPPLGGGGR